MRGRMQVKCDILHSEWVMEVSSRLEASLLELRHQLLDGLDLKWEETT